MKRPLARLLPVAALLATLACTETLPHATSADATRVAARYPNATLASLDSGRLLYVQRCGGCHALREPASLPPDAWPGRVQDMQKNKGVRLGADDADSIIAYLVAVSSR